LIFAQNTPKDEVPCKEVPFGVLKTKSNCLGPYFSKKTDFLGPVLTGLNNNTNFSRDTAHPHVEIIEFIITDEQIDIGRSKLVCDMTT